MCMLKQFAISFANSVCITWPTVNVQMYLYTCTYIHDIYYYTCTCAMYVYIYTTCTCIYIPTLWDALCCFVKSVFTTFTSTYAHVHVYNIFMEASVLCMYMCMYIQYVSKKLLFI